MDWREEVGRILSKAGKAAHKEKANMNRNLLRLAAATISLLLSHAALAETGFTYQGQLQQGGVPFTGAAYVHQLFGRVREAGSG